MRFLHVKTLTCSLLVWLDSYSKTIRVWQYRNPSRLRNQNPSPVQGILFCPGDFLLKLNHKCFFLSQSLISCMTIEVVTTSEPRSFIILNTEDKKDLEPFCELSILFPDVWSIYMPCRAGQGKKNYGLFSGLDKAGYKKVPSDGLCKESCLKTFST